MDVKELLRQINNEIEILEDRISNDGRVLKTFKSITLKQQCIDAIYINQIHLKQLQNTVEVITEFVGDYYEK